MFKVAWICFHLCAVVRASEIPFRFSEGLIWVEVSVTGRESKLQFVLDSGATVSVLDRAACEELGTRKGKRVQVAGVGSVVKGYWPARLSAHAQETELPQNYLVLDLAAFSQKCGMQVNGLIGADFFADRVVQIDYRRQIIRILPEAPRRGETLVTLPLRKGAQGALLTRVTVDSRAEWARADTGFAGSLDWVRNDGVELAPMDRRISVGLTQVSTPLERMTLELGSISLANVETGLHSQPIFPSEAGLLGNGIFSRFTVTFDLPGGQIAFSK